MIGLLMGFGLGKWAARAIAYVAVPLIVIGLLWWAITSYGSRRYQAGVDATDAKWEEASNRLKDEAANSATRADDNAAVRIETHRQQVEEEQDAIEAATRNGMSPFDALFGP